MTIQQIYDKALEEGALNYHLFLDGLCLHEENFVIDHGCGSVDIIRD